MPPSFSSHSSIKANDQEAIAAATTAENSHLTLKGKRTKRSISHPPQPSPAATTSSTATSFCVAEASSSSTSSAVLTEEEEDMANCLILLAQGQGQPQEQPLTKFSYECKTCSKSFPTFQALGGHRASHKKLKTSAPNDQDKFSPPRYLEPSIAKLTPPATTKQRLHECSICGLEFTSGQALGGHMRRHRPAVVAEPTQVNKEKNLLSWDLNLPAPEEVATAAAAAGADNGNDGLFVFPASKQQQPILLVDCHY